jgi:hypothetical protein
MDESQIVVIENTQNPRLAGVLKANREFPKIRLIRFLFWPHSLIFATPNLFFGRFIPFHKDRVSIGKNEI